MRRMFTFIPRIHSAIEHYTALTRLKQTVGGMNAARHTRLLFGRWMEQPQWWRWPFLQMTLFPFYRKLAHSQKKKHFIMCHYRVSHRAPFWNCCFFFIIHKKKETQHIVFGSQEEKGTCCWARAFCEFHLQYVCCSWDRKDEDKGETYTRLRWSV